MADHIVRADQVNAQVTTSSVLNVHSNSNMLNTSEVGVLEHILSNFKRYTQTISTLGDRLLDMNPRREIP